MPSPTSFVPANAYPVAMMRGAAAVTRASEEFAVVLVRLVDLVPSTPARIARALVGLILAVTAVMSSAALCGPLDFQCKADAWGQGVVEGLRATFSSLTQSMIQGIFSGSLGTIGQGGWAAGITLAGRVGAIVAVVVVALAGVQIASTLISGQRQGVLRAAIGAALAWPVTSAAVWVAMKLVAVVDAISTNMVEESHMQTLSGLADFTMTTGGSTPFTAGLVAMFFVFCVFVPTVLLSLMMAFRNYGIVLAIAIAPVSLMVWGFGPLREMSRGWIKVILALILTKPVLAIALVLAAEMIVDSAANVEIGGFLTGVAGLAMAVLAPFAAMGMVSGAMAVADGNIMRGAEGAAGRAATRAGHEAVGHAKQAGSTAIRSAAQSNPKTAALWSMAHGRIPFRGGANAPEPTQGQPVGSAGPVTSAQPGTGPGMPGAAATAGGVRAKGRVQAPTSGRLQSPVSGTPAPSAASTGHGHGRDGAVATPSPSPGTSERGSAPPQRPAGAPAERPSGGPKLS